MSFASVPHETAIENPSVWLAVNTHPHREAVAVENLLRQGFTPYCPQVMRERRHGRRVVTVKKSLFPSYVFVELNQRTQRWRPILSTLGVRTVVCVGDRPGTVPAGFIAALRNREIEGAIPAAREQWHCGQQVRVTSGALQGLVGTIVEMSERERIFVLMDLLKQQVRVQVDRSRLVAASGVQ